MGANASECCYVHMLQGQQPATCHLLWYKLRSLQPCALTQLYTVIAFIIIKWLSGLSEVWINAVLL